MVKFIWEREKRMIMKPLLYLLNIFLCWENLIMEIIRLKYVYWEIMLIIWIMLERTLREKWEIELENNISDEVEEKMLGIVGKDGLGHIIIIISTFIWTLFQNWIGLLGYSEGSNSGLVFNNLVSSMLIFIYITYMGIETRGWGYSDVFIPYSAPSWIRPFMSIIESISYCSRIVSLCTRLTANVFGGHILTGIISKFLSYMRDKTTIVGFWLLILLIVLEISVGFLQSYIYVILFIIYLKDIYKSH